MISISNIQNIPLALIVLDGFGIAPKSRGNAISEAKMPFFNSLIRNFQTFSIAAGGEAVGLPWGEPGNSEVGHQNLGAGKIVYQDVLRINKSIEDKSFFENQELLGLIAHCKKHNSSMHILGILSDGGVHGHVEHIYAALELAGRNNLKQVYIHIILDGRDTAFDSGLEYVKQLEKVIKRVKIGEIASISGRFFAMDRDNKWDRVEKAYKAIVKSESENVFKSPKEAIQASYENKIYDEEFVPAVIRKTDAKDIVRVQPGDGVFFTNYRPDRAKEITSAFVSKDFKGFSRSLLGNLYFVGMTEYSPNLKAHVAFRKDAIEFPLARVLSEAGLAQLHIAETEKYAHVTYFFNGGKDIVFKGEKNMIIPSAGVAQYDEKPQMSANEITKKVMESLKAGAFHFYIVNYANADMVGHTGNLRATVQSLGIIDDCLKQVVSYIAKLGGMSVITADHGNAEDMVNWENGHIIKEHSASSVPCVLVGQEFKLSNPKTKDFFLDSLKVTGVLSDVAPTIIKILGLQKPLEMTSRSLI
ncbi:MAG: 2,3-bisphosphoglycerate-independent phosphoglycerate mutase [Parcubacteria group bacterium CG_4_9_14_0_2_um_filter_41_8]|nr:MAG: phosphoglycerate mutase (2,3-diphosphoglycerate-independent) [Parcubacteria group bacterium CG1_02_41_12]PIP67224.1 MAG: phosphoglycerate mutase (2,3-diphosphoglycerate-independent) [Parcubacteria group bacterium CG22_combo_CG10-13_8_21_14_all_41_9]PIQ78911.1 MAG: phosphoglycerate mutase (2,3-diphosphoglycerate-independent) [Parcubacteria group bacterium CG11_big_fil_rev_8_21_14_0_20_41_14]PIR56755.1 MAG: 2,3-bisphosphoglycerate-independent phosphoglycerate mutase [Parcubacteria group ba